jgi:hypothetical protein
LIKSTHVGRDGADLAAAAFLTVSLVVVAFLVVDIADSEAGWLLMMAKVVTGNEGGDGVVVGSKRVASILNNI